ncbi:MAG: hypothetical protein IKJ11_06190 [Clostridia bacterium]|nr:hypothetical protein [Clostridia bacterium]
MRLPLESWTLRMQQMPDRLKDDGDTRAFSLPGADMLGEFADLIGGDAGEDMQPAQEEGARYALCGLFEDDMPGEISLVRQIDFGALSGDRALITFEHIAGRGEILLGGRQIAAFDSENFTTDALLGAFDMEGMPCRLCADVTDALLLGRQETLEIRFSGARPAGVCGAAFLHVSSGAYLSRVSIQGDAGRRTMTVRARVTAIEGGEYIFRAQMTPERPGMTPPPARETGFTLQKGMEKTVVLSMEAPFARFVPGSAYHAPAMRIRLLSAGKRKGRERPCDDALLLCGFGADAPKAFLPIDDRDCMGDADALAGWICDLHVPAVLLGAPAPDGVYRAFGRAGVAACQYAPEMLRPALTRYPCLSLLSQPAAEERMPPEACAWQMTGSVAYARAVDESLTADELLYDASGRRLDSGEAGVRASLAWLRCVQIRLRAEAARQGRWQGALCSAGEAKDPEICQALRTAFAPVHLSALPLCGAWWTGTRFSASLEAFLPENHGGKIRALAVLEDEEGHEIARYDAPCAKSGYAGVIEAQLPEKACVLILNCRLMQDDDVIEESSLPVYVGELGPLEAAF